VFFSANYHKKSPGPGIGYSLVFKFFFFNMKLELVKKKKYLDKQIKETMKIKNDFLT